VQSHVSHLRQVLGSRTAIGSRPPGYVLDLGTEATDVQAAERLVRDAAAVADPTARERGLRAALALWRGQPLANLAALAGSAVAGRAGRTAAPALAAGAPVPAQDPAGPRGGRHARTRAAPAP
jgi:hypothetical protein